MALVPETVMALTRAGHRVLIETAAGIAAGHSDEDYRNAGAEVVSGIPLDEVSILTHITPLPPASIARLQPGAITIGLMAPFEARIEALQSAGITALACEKIPRTSRAQAMDVLSSQALAAGYRCVLEAAIRLPRFFPLAMTAAGTVPPAKVVVLGIGVAGLQAIATAKRLGATVAANDIRPSSAEEARSVGATFIDVGLDSAEGAGQGGYARSLAADAASRQQAALAPHIADADVLITTAGVPGKSAPRLATAEMIAAMRPGSVVVDMLAASGGNVEGSVAGEDIKVASARGQGEITIVGLDTPPAQLPADASRLYAKNMQNMIGLLIKDGEINVDFDDDIIAGSAITHNGVNLLEDPPTPTEAPQPEQGGAK